MQVTSSSMTALSTDPKLVIDFSRMKDSVSNPQRDEEISNLIYWVKAYPQRSNLHVYLRSSVRSATGKKLQNTLQALGCTVTTKAAI